MARTQITSADTARPSAQVLRLVPRTEKLDVDRDLVDALSSMLDAAQAGHLLGMVFGVAFQGQKFLVDSVGSLHHNQVTGLGVCTMLTAELEHRVRQNAIEEDGL